MKLRPEIKVFASLVGFIILVALGLFTYFSVQGLRKEVMRPVTVRLAPSPVATATPSATPTVSLKSVKTIVSPTAAVK